MLGFSSLTSLTLADDTASIITFSLTSVSVLTGAPTVDSVILSVPFTTVSVVTGAPTVDTATLTYSYFFSPETITTGAPVVDAITLAMSNYFPDSYSTSRVDYVTELNRTAFVPLYEPRVAYVPPELDRIVRVR